MKCTKLCSVTLWKDSFLCSVSLIAAIETLCAIADFSINDICNDLKWWNKGLIIFQVFVLLFLITGCIKAISANRSVSLKIRGVSIKIKTGNIFESTDWKLIPFNEFFDTQVDDVVIARNSLNGKFIDSLSDIDDLNRIIAAAENTPGMKYKKKSGRTCYQLGQIIPYQDYMLLAFSHFENNQAKLSQNDYEACLRTMWNEISRVYANRPVTIPLLGGGITRITDKNDFHLLRCILCTLKTSNAEIYQPITIILTKESMDKINLYDIKKHFSHV